MNSISTFGSRGPHNWVSRYLQGARRAAADLERGSSRPLMIPNVTPSGLFIGDADETLHRITKALRDSQRLYRQGNTVVYLTGGTQSDGGCAPTPIAIDGVITKTAPETVGNVLMCRELKVNSKGKGARVDQPDEFEVQFPVPKSVLQQVAAMDGFIGEIPEARYIVQHPVFDADFNWLDTGYHRDQKIFVCGNSFEPAMLAPQTAQEAPQTVADVMDRLPPLIRRMVGGFYWGSPIDLINYIGAALMIPLISMLVDDKHPGVMVWANKPGIGKSLACQCLAVLKDGTTAGATAIDSGSREVENQIASELNDGKTVMFIDNQKGTLNVPVLEANMTSSQIAIRGFNTQKKIRRPNDLLWLITTNDAVPSDDLLSRCINIRLHYEGEPDSRAFQMSDGELTDYVRDNRSEILSELAGMVVRWLDAGRPSAPAPCRFTAFGHVVGSVLTANGLPGLLSNTREEVRQHSATHQQLIALAERLIDSRDQSFVFEFDGDIEAADDEFKRQPRPESPREQKDWVHYLAGAGVITAACSTPEKQKTAATRYLNSVLKVPVEVDIGEDTVEAMIVSRPLGKRRTAYALAVKGLSAIAGVEQASDAEMDLLASDAAGEEPASDRELPALNQPSDRTMPPDQPGEVPGAQPDGNEPEDDLWS